MPVIATPVDAVRELAEYRTLRSKVFDLGGNQRKLIQKLGRVHFRDDDTQLKDIETDTEVEEGTGDIIARRLPYRFRLRKQGIGFDYESREGGIVRVALLRTGTNVIDQNATFVFTRNANRIVFSNVDTDLDIIFHITRGGIKTYRVLKSSSAPRSFRWAVEYDEQGQGKVDTSIRGVDNLDGIARPGIDRREVNVSVVNGDPVLQQSGRWRYIANETWTGETKFIDPVTRIASWVNDALYPVAIDPDITENIGATADDGYERNTVDWNSGTNFCDFGKYSIYRHPGWRFQTVAVANAATISLANLIIRATSSTGTGGRGVLYGYDTDNAAALSFTVRPTVMTKTTASLSIAYDATSGLRTYDVTSIVQEIVNRAGWASGNNMTIFGIGTSGAYNRTRFEDYSAAGTDEAQLEITFPATSKPWYSYAQQM